jgi:hypothetical protein
MGLEVNEFWSCLQWALLGGHRDYISFSDAEGRRRELQRLTSLRHATDRSFLQLIGCIDDISWFSYKRT